MNWGPVLNRLKTDPRSSHFTPHAFDLLAHGRRGGESLPRPLTGEAVAEDLLRQVPPGPFVGVGHSYGLRPLLKIAAQDPQRLVKLIVEDASPVISGAGMGQLTSIFNEVPMPCSTREEAKRVIEEIYGEGQLSKFLLSNVREVSPGVHDWRFQKQALAELLEDARRHELWDEWKSYPGPVGMILGASASYVTPEALEKCLQLREGKATEVSEIRGAGHWVHADQLNGFFEALIKMIKVVS